MLPHVSIHFNFICLKSLAIIMKESDILYHFAVCLRVYGEHCVLMVSRLNVLIDL